MHETYSAKHTIEKVALTVFVWKHVADYYKTVGTNENQLPAAKTVEVLQSRFYQF